jgi:MFS family permease
MHGFDDAPAKPDDPSDGRPWYSLLSRYHWFVLAVCALGWLFDCLDQQLFILARPAAMKQLITQVPVDPAINPSGFSEDPKDVEPVRRRWGDIATSVFIAGWATGGLVFGMLGDRIGRAKTMMITILLYSFFTGLSAISKTVYDFAFYRFLTGLGVGGEFAVGVALVAEVMPTRARPYTLALLQALSAIGNVSAALINLGLGAAAEDLDLFVQRINEPLQSWTGGYVTFPSDPWRIMFLIGALPALLALVIRGRLKEPEQWLTVSDKPRNKVQLGSYAELFGDPRWRKNAIVGLLLACSGVIGLWAVGFYSPDLVRQVMRPRLAAEVYDEQIVKAGDDTALKGRLQQLKDIELNRQAVPEELKPTQAGPEKIIGGRLASWGSYTSIAINFGAFLGMFGFGWLAQVIGRRPTFAIALVAAFVTTVATFWYLREFWQVFVFVPIMGFCQLSLFAGYAIYFPELFPTRLRSTGTSFCYNVGRFVAAGGPLAKSALDQAFGAGANPDSIRYAGVTMCAVFLIGLFVLPFAPETKGQPLPE